MDESLGNFVLEELKRLNKKLENIENEVHEIKIAQAVSSVIIKEISEIRNQANNLSLKINSIESKAAAYGSLAGIIVTLIGFAIQYIKN